jgi:hypothetical protein
MPLQTVFIPFILVEFFHSPPKATISWNKFHNNFVLSFFSFDNILGKVKPLAKQHTNRKQKQTHKSPDRL